LTNELTQWENSPLRQSSQSYRTVVTHSANLHNPTGQLLHTAYSLNTFILKLNKKTQPRIMSG